MMHLVLTIDIHGDVDQSGLERLRTHLDLKKQGRLTDDWDQEFGHRVIEATSGIRTDVGLFRNFDETWKISVLSTSQPDPSNDELQLLRDALVEGIIAAGYRATVRARPTFGTNP